MTRHIRHAAVFSLLLLGALLVNLTRVQVVQAPAFAANPANRRAAILGFGHPRGDIWAGTTRLTGSRRVPGGTGWERTYTDGPLYAPVTGYASRAYGTTLLENAGDALLTGGDPTLAAFPPWNAVARVPAPGGRLYSTIDPAAQRAAYQGLAGRAGAVAALDPATGRILALVSTPSYDPAAFAGDGAASPAAWRRLTEDPRQPLLDRAIRQTYPPGSTFKVVTAAAALESGRVTDPAAATDSPDPYPLPGSGARLGNEAAGCRDASLAYAFRVSCNTVFAKLGVEVGAAAMTRAARAFGFGDPDLGIPSTVAESVFAPTADKAHLALSSIGQYDTRATPLQMAMVAAAVADDGTVMSPYLVDHETTADGRVVATTRPRVLDRAMSARTASVLRGLMTDVVRDGTGTGAALPGVVVGGKTGTAQHGVANRGTPYAWFVSWARPPGVGTAPVAVAVVVEDAAADRGDISGGGDAAPIARAVMRAVLGGR